MTSQAYLGAGLRSPIGRFGGALAPLRATEIASYVGTGLLRRHNVPLNAVQRVIGGMVLQDMTESNPARIVAKRMGIPDTVPAFTINMQCCSGMQALILAAQQIALEDIDCVLVVGLESMSNAPHMLHGARWGLGHAQAELIDTLKECTCAGSKMWDDPWYMIDVAENHAKVDAVSREEMDEYALISHQRAIDAIDQGRLTDEIQPIEVPHAQGSVLVETDEHPRRGLTPEQLANLRTVQPGGTITAGNAAGINDGAAAALVCSEGALDRLGVEPLAKILMPGTSMVGCDPQRMGYSCIEALNTSLAAAALRLDDIDLIECNEGFAVQLVACRRLGHWPPERLNVDGGSIALGHPVGMSGLRIVIHLARALAQRDLSTGAATIPAGSGLGTALILSRK